MTPHIRNVVPAYRLAHLQQCIYKGAHMKTNRKATDHAKGVDQGRVATRENPAYKAQKQTFYFVVFFFTVLAVLAFFF